MRTKKCTQPRVSVIVPTLNEHDSIAKFLQQPALDHCYELIVVDASPEPMSVDHPKLSMLLRASAQRAQQMNCGASHATGDLLLFLHADTHLPAKAIQLIQSQCSGERSVGCFRRRFCPAGLLLNTTSRLADLRIHCTFWAFGDQAIFITRSYFHELGGYRELDRFEDLDLCRRAKRHGQRCIITTPAISNSRRFHRSPMRRLIKDALLSLGFLCGLIRE